MFCASHRHLTEFDSVFLSQWAFVIKEAKVKLVELQEEEEEVFITGHVN
jgi:hypothetical protein